MIARAKRLFWWAWGYLKATWRFLRHKPVRVVLLLLSLGLGSLAGIPPGNVMFMYTWADHRMCDDCHIHDYANEAYIRSVHFGLTTCHDCHRVPITHYPYNLYSTIVIGKRTTEDLHRPDTGMVVCTQCHSVSGDEHPLTGPMDESVRERIVRIDESPLHITHLRAESKDPGNYRGGGVHGEEAAAKHEEEAAAKHDGGDDGHGDDGDEAGHGVEGGHGEEEGDHGGGHGEEGGIRGILLALSPSHGDLPPWASGAITCMDCHGAENNRAHRFEASRDNCLGCHKALAVISDKFEHISCQECHFRGFAGKPGHLVEGFADGGHGGDAGHGEEPAHGEDAHH